MLPVIETKPNFIILKLPSQPQTTQNFTFTNITTFCCIFFFFYFHTYPESQTLYKKKPPFMMLLRGIISTPLSSSLRFKSNHPRNFAVSAQISSTTSTGSSYSISDEALQSRGFIFRRTIDGLNLDQLNSVFVAVGFPKRDPAKIRIALENTDSLLWVEYKKTQKPVAFARATGDGVFNAIIWDVVVDPSFQGIGLGKAVMERLIEELLGKGICNIALYSEPRVLGFYRPLGFVADPGGIRGMVYSRKRKNKK